MVTKIIIWNLNQFGSTAIEIMYLWGWRMPPRQALPEPYCFIKFQYVNYLNGMVCFCSNERDLSFLFLSVSRCTQALKYSNIAFQIPKSYNFPECLAYTTAVKQENKFATYVCSLTTHVKHILLILFWALPLF